MHQPHGAADGLAVKANGRNGHPSSTAAAMNVEPYFCPTDADPFDTVEWEARTAHIKDENGGILFEQTDCQIPAEWSPLATNVVVSKYFYGEPGTPERETSVQQVIYRVARTIADLNGQDTVPTEAIADASGSAARISWEITLPALHLDRCRGGPGFSFHRHVA